MNKKKLTNACTNFKSLAFIFAKTKDIYDKKMFILSLM